MSEPSIEEAKKDVAILAREIELLYLITDSATELSTHDDMEASWYRNVAIKTSSHLSSALALQAHIKQKYNL